MVSVRSLTSLRSSASKSVTGSADVRSTGSPKMRIGLTLMVAPSLPVPRLFPGSHSLRSPGSPAPAPALRSLGGLAGPARAGATARRRRAGLERRLAGGPGHGGVRVVIAEGGQQVRHARVADLPEPSHQFRLRGRWDIGKQLRTHVPGVGLFEQPRSQVY